MEDLRERLESIERSVADLLEHIDMLSRDSIRQAHQVRDLTRVVEGMISDVDQRRRSQRL